MISNAIMPLLFQLHTIPVASVVVEEEILAGAGYPVYEKPKKRKKRHNIGEMLEMAMEEIYELATSDETSKATQQAAARIVKPYTKSKAEIPDTDKINWVALEKNMERVEALIALWQEELEIESENEQIIMEAYMRFYN